MEQPYAVGAVDKALSILVLLRQRSTMSIHELSQELGVTRSTVHRLLATMRARQFVIQDPATRTYLLGPFLTDLGIEPESVTRLRGAAKPHIQALSREFGETVQLMVLAGRACRFIDGVSADRPLRTSVRVGSVLPAHATSGGKAMLAELSDDRVRKLFHHELTALTPQTVVDIDSLLDQLRFVRRHGYAINDRESEEGITAFSVVIRVSDAVIGAVAMSLPSVRAGQDLVPAFVRGLKRTAGSIQEELA